MLMFVDADVVADVDAIDDVDANVDAVADVAADADADCTVESDADGNEAAVDELEDRLEREGAKSSEVQISLMWDNYNDLD